MISQRIIFEGRVQGVGFRYTAKDLAKGFDVVGSVRNLPEGSVELLIMGEREEINAFLHEITVESPVSHHIQNVSSTDIPPLTSTRGFTIER